MFIQVHLCHMPKRTPKLNLGSRGERWSVITCRDHKLDLGQVSLHSSPDTTPFPPNDISFCVTRPCFIDISVAERRWLRISSDTMARR